MTGAPSPAFAAAALSLDLAREGCAPACRAYHGTRMLLRALRLTSEPSDQREFFRAALGALPDPAEVVISGSSDTGMPELVAGLTAGRGGRITVVDLCPTPLRLIDAVLAPDDARLRTVCADIRDFPGTGGADALVSHSFFGQIAPQGRPAVLASWFRLLRPGGVVATVNRLHPAGGRRGFDPAAGAALAAEADRRLVASGAAPLFDRAALRADLAAYAANRVSYPVASVAALTDLFTAAGFTVVSAEAVQGPQRVAGLSGPSLATGGVYCHLVARRPEAVTPDR